MTNTTTGQAPVNTNGDGGASFLERERAALGEDADQFATAQDGPNTATATVEDGDDDLLGGDDDYTAAPMESNSQFESSFPAIETQNAVRYRPLCTKHDGR